MDKGSLMGLLRQQAWKADASCMGQTDLFYPDPRHPDLEEILDVTKEICKSCPVKVECGKHADGRPEEFGVWAGKWREADYQ